MTGSVRPRAITGSMQDRAHFTAVASLETAPQEAPPQSAGRPPGDAQTFTQVCDLIKTDGVSDAEAALLAGQDAAWLQAWVEAHVYARRDLDAARAAYRRECLQLIRTCVKKDDIDWRA